jgi:hypothetical protein
VFSSPRGAAAWIGGDNYGMGAAAGQYIAEQMKAKGVSNPIIGEVQGIANLPLTQDRTEGFDEALAAAGMKVSNRVSAEFTVESGQQVTANLLQAAPKLDALWNHDDDQGIGVLAAIDQAGRTSSSWSAAPARRTRWSSSRPTAGVLKATVTYPPSMASDAINLARLVAQDKGMSDLVENEIPASITLASATVTKENVDKYLPLGLRLLMAADPTRQDGRHIGVGMIGYAFMGATHSQAWRTAGPVLRPAARAPHVVLCGRNAAAAQAAAIKLGWDRVETDWRAVVAADDVQLVDVGSPGDTHAEIAIAALEAGKHVLCEKPLANSVTEAESWSPPPSGPRRTASGPWSASTTAACRRSRSPAGSSPTGGSGRSGTCGRSTSRTGSWTRSSRWSGGSEGQGRLGRARRHRRAHRGRRAVRRRRRPHRRQRADRDVRQGAAAGRGELGLSGHSSGSGDRRGHRRRRGAVHRPLRRRRARLVRGDPVRDRPQEHDPAGGNGSLGSIAFDFEAMNELQVHDASGLWVTRPGRVHPGHRHRSRRTRTWRRGGPPGHPIGYEHTFTHEVVDLVRDIAAGRDPWPSFADGLQVQRVLAAVEESAGAESRWTAIPN